MKTENKYDFFISYKHAEMDGMTAEYLQNVLEHYRIPKELRDSSSTNKFIRVFRDKSDLALSGDLTADVFQRLQEVDYLLVICSTRAKESRWVNQEITEFLRTHDKQRIIPILVEGEPEDAFPEALTRDGIEPLAADCRGETKREVRKKIRAEKYRLIASILSCSYDELIQRNKVYQIKKSIFIASLIALFSIIFGMVMLFQNIRISELNQDILSNQAELLAEKSASLYQNGFREEALDAALSALKHNKGSLNSVRALENALGLYRTDSKFSIFPGKTFRMNDTAYSKYAVDDQANVLATVDIQGTFYFWDLNTGTLISSYFFEKMDDIFNQADICLRKDHLAYLKINDEYCCFDYISKEIKWENHLDYSYDISQICKNQDELWICGTNYQDEIMVSKLNLENGEEEIIAQVSEEELFGEVFWSFYEISHMTVSDDQEHLWIACEETSSGNSYLLHLNLKNGKSLEVIKDFQNEKIAAFHLMDENQMLLLVDQEDTIYDVGLYHYGLSYHLYMLDLNTMEMLWNVDGDVIRNGTAHIFVTENETLEPEKVITVINRTEVMNLTMEGEVLSKYSYSQKVMGCNETSGDLVYVMTEDGVIHKTYKRTFSIRDDRYGESDTGVTPGLVHFNFETKEWIVISRDGRNIFVYEYKLDPEIEYLYHEGVDAWMVSSDDNYGLFTKKDSLNLMNLQTQEIVWSIRDESDDFGFNHLNMKCSGFIGDYAYGTVGKTLYLYSLTENAEIATYTYESPYSLNFWQVFAYKDQNEELNFRVYTSEREIIHLQTTDLKVVETMDCRKYDLETFADIMLLNGEYAVINYENDSKEEATILWNLAKDEEKNISDAVMEAMDTCVVMSSDQEYLAFVGTDGKIHVVDSNTAKCIRDFTVDHCDRLECLFFSPDHKYLYAQTFDYHLLGFDIADNREVMNIDTPKGAISKIYFSQENADLMLRFETFTDDMGSYLYQYQEDGKYDVGLLRGSCITFTENYLYYLNNTNEVLRIPRRTLEEEIEMASHGDVHYGFLSVPGGS